MTYSSAIYLPSQFTANRQWWVKGKRVVDIEVSVQCFEIWQLKTSRGQVKKEEEGKESQNSTSRPNWGKVDFFQASSKNPIFIPLLPTKSASEEHTSKCTLSSWKFWPSNCNQTGGYRGRESTCRLRAGKQIEFTHLFILSTNIYWFLLCARH